MQLTEEILRAWLDHALPPETHRAVEAHLAESPEAQRILARLRQNRQHLAAAFNTLAPAPSDLSTSRRALQRLQTGLAQHPVRRPIGLTERMMTMFNQSKLKQFQPALTAVAIVTMLALLLSFAPVRAAAGNFLQIFRMQQVKVVPVDMAQMESLSDNGDLNALLEQFDPEASVVSGGGEPRKMPSVGAANRAVPFAVRSPSGVGRPTTVYVAEQTVANLRLDRDLVAAVFEAADIAVDLPASLSDTPIVITKPDTVMMDWSSEGDGNLEFMQMPVPQIEYPDDLDLNALGVAGLQLLGMSQAEAEALGATIDFANTLVLPFPTDADMSYREVSINGGQGIVVSNDTATGKNESGLMWQADGMSYFIAGDFSADELILLAESVK